VNRTAPGSIIDIMHSLSSGGVRHFPKPQSPLPDQASHPTPPQKTSQESSISTCLEVAPNSRCPTLLSSLPECKDCPLSQNRTRVVTPHQFIPQKVMVVSDYPEPADESAPLEEPLFTAHKSPHQVLQRMFHYLGISQSIHRTFAIKCTAPRGIPNTSAQSCAKYLLAEIACVNPEIIICSGLRSARSILSTAIWNFAETPELGEIGSIPIEGRPRRLLLIPSATELEANEKWRGPVGAFLKQALAQV
jgi:uracil-DNA glycosylase family 4